VTWDILKLYDGIHKSSIYYYQKGTSRRRITVKASLYEISTDQPGNTVVGGGEGRELLTLTAPTPF
jgi:hypothetical protein